MWIRLSILLALLASTTSGCSSDNASNSGGLVDGAADATAPEAGQEGSPGTGQGGADAGRDSSGDGGNRGPTDSGQGGALDAEAGPPMCASTTGDMSPCNGDPPCNKQCGLNLFALTTSLPVKTCTCSGSSASGGRWSCPNTPGACVYPSDVDLTCAMLPTPLSACPLDTPDGGGADAGRADGGSNLIVSNVSSCMVPQSEVCGGVCGSAAPNVFSYQNSAGVGQVGYCLCVAGIWECASVNDWPHM